MHGVMLHAHLRCFIWSRDIWEQSTRVHLGVKNLTLLGLKMFLGFSLFNIAHYLLV